MAPQAVAHRRGGTHKVKDEDRTDSIYDTYNYKELLDTAKERGIYRKDMKKGEMAWALKRNDEEKKRAQHQAKIEYELKQQQARQEQEKKDAQLQALVIAKHKRRIERMQKRDRDESVSDDTPSENEAEANEDASDLVGQALSDESWDSTSTESSTYSTSHIPAHDCRLRLFEWPYDYMPHPDPVAKTVADLARLPDPPPRPVPYAPLKLTTTHTRQKLILPGHKYPLTVAPNYVPILPSETRSSAHSYQHQQRLAGLLRNAVVETGAFWASKTVVQGSTGRMYFHLGSRNESKSLADTYQKWYLEDRRLLRVGVGTGHAGGLGKDERTWRHKERRRNQGRKVAEVYESSKWRPVAMGFLPAYLDFGEPKGQSAWGRERGRSLANLRYVRFQGCDVPQYYFWVKEGEVGFVRDRGIFGLEWVGGEDETDEEEEEEEEEEEAEYEELGGHIIDDSSNDSLTSAKALYRRSSAVRIHSQNNKHAVVEKWLDETSPSPFPSSQAPDFPSTSALAFLDTYPNTADSTDEKDEEEEVERPTRPTCPFCNLHWNDMVPEDQAAHMLSHSSISQPPDHHSFVLPRITTILKPNEDDGDVGMQADVDTPIKPRHRRRKKSVSTRREQREKMQRRVVGCQDSRVYDTWPFPSPSPVLSSHTFPSEIDTMLTPLSALPPSNLVYREDRKRKFDWVSPALSDTNLPLLPPLKRRKRKETYDTSEPARGRCAYERQKTRADVAKLPWEYASGDKGSAAWVLGKDWDGEGGEGKGWSRCVVS